MKKITSVFLFFILFFSGTATAQFDCPDPKRCTSKDLEVIGASITGVEDCFACEPGTEITTTITLRIYNKTGSVRTSFALFGTFVHGTTSEPIFICGGTIAAGDTTDIVSGEVTFTCGESLKLTDNFLAWTDASDGAKNTCAAIEAGNCKTIAPKCGTAAEIIIAGPVSGSVTDSFKPCEGSCDGTITVTATGGTAPYTYTLDGTPDTSIGPKNGSATFINLCAGAKTVTIVDAKGCEATVNFTLEDKECCVAPPKPTMCETPAGLCGDGKVSLTISNAVTGDTYCVIQGSDTTCKLAAGSTVTFTGLTPGVAFKAYGKDEVNGTVCTSDTATCADLTGTCAPTVTNAAARAQTQAITLPDASTKVKAAPNPFNDRIKFSLESAVSGQGSLELYNTLGQKVKTVFQGYIKKGQVQTIEYGVPGPQRSNLVYVFRVGEQKITGKLIGLK